MSVSDQQLRAAVDAVFDKFDTDKSGSLDPNEVHNLINAALGHCGKQAISKEQCDQFVQAVDKDGNGKIEKMELYNIFKQALGC